MQHIPFPACREMEALYNGPKKRMVPRGEQEGNGSINEREQLMRFEISDLNYLHIHVLLAYMVPLQPPNSLGDQICPQKPTFHI